MSKPRQPVALPHVRVETRRVFVSPRGARLTKHAAYVHAAKALIAAKCQCESEPEVNYHATCRFHEPCCTDREGNYGQGCGHEHYMPHYVRVRRRLIGFLKFIDARHSAAQKGLAA